MFNCLFEFFLIFKELQALQTEKDHLFKERDDLSDRLLKQEKKQEGRFTRIILSALFCLCFSPSFYLTLLRSLPLCVCLCVHMCAEWVDQAVSQASAALRAELDEERRKYQGLLREFTRLEQRYDNLREMSLLTEVHNYSPPKKTLPQIYSLLLNPILAVFFSPNDSVLKATEGQTPPRV